MNKEGKVVHRSPSSIRDEVFAHRRRGLDEEEVRDFLDLLADQTQASDHELHAMRTENERLRSELEQARSKLAEFDAAGDRVSEQTVELFSQAQMVAEEMVEDVRRDARQRLEQARSQERKILQEAMETAERTRADAEAVIARTAPGSANGLPPNPTYDGSFGRESARPGADSSAAAAELEHVRSFAQVAQAQMQSIMDSLATQVQQLGEAPAGRDPGPPTQQRNGSRPEDNRGWQGDVAWEDRPDPWGSG